jgi:hypothetical protein
MPSEFRFRRESIARLEKNVIAAFNKAIVNEQMLNTIGEEIVEDVKTQTRKGLSIPNKLQDLKLLKEKWITRKERLKTVNSTDPSYEEGASNLSFTGQLLNSFSHAIRGPGRILLYFHDFHQPYKNLNGTTSGEEIPNATLAKYLADKGRPFVGVRPSMRLRINRIVKDYVKRAMLAARLTKTGVDK